MRNLFTKSRSIDIDFKSLNKKKLNKEDLKSLRTQFYYYFKKAEEEKRRKLFEVALFFRWHEELQYALNNGVIPSGKLLLTNLVKGQLQSQNQLNEKLAHHHPLANYMKNPDCVVTWTPLTWAIFARDFEAISQLWPHANHLESLSLVFTPTPIYGPGTSPKEFLYHSPLFLLLNNLIFEKEKEKNYFWIEKYVEECQSVEELEPTRPHYAPTYIISIRDAKAMQLLSSKITTWNEKDDDNETRLEWFLNDFQNNLDFDEDGSEKTSDVIEQLEIFKILLDHSEVNEDLLNQIHENTDLESMYSQYIKSNLAQTLSPATASARTNARL